MYGLFNFFPQSKSLATGKSSVSREIFRIPRGNLFLSFGQQREAFLPCYDGYSCVFGRARVCSVDRPLRISRGISKIVLLTAVFAAFSWRTARKPDRCFFFFFFRIRNFSYSSTFKHESFHWTSVASNISSHSLILPRTLRYMYGILYTLHPYVARTRFGRETFPWISNNVAYLLEQTSS